MRKGVKGNWENGKWIESNDPNNIWDERISNNDFVFVNDGYIGPHDDGVHSGLDGGKSKRKRKRSNKKYNKKTKRKRTRRSRR